MMNPLTIGMWNPVPGIRNPQLGNQNPGLSWITLQEATVKLALNIATSYNPHLYNIQSNLR